jgi:hypothetical protein
MLEYVLHYLNVSLNSAKHFVMPIECDYAVCIT